MEVIILARKKTKRNDNNLAIAYYRFSSHSQNEASIDQQRELAHEWADAHGLKIVRECEDEHSIKAYFEKFLHADFDSPETRDMILEYFVDKIYLYDEKLVVTSWYSEDKTEITWDRKVPDGKPIFGVYKGVRVGVIKTNGKPATVFPDVNQSSVLKKGRKSKC